MNILVCGGDFWLWPWRESREVFKANFGASHFPWLWTLRRFPALDSVPFVLWPVQGELLVNKKKPSWPGLLPSWNEGQETQRERMDGPSLGAIEKDKRPIFCHYWYWIDEILFSISFLSSLGCQATRGWIIELYRDILILINQYPIIQALECEHGWKLILPPLSTSNLRRFTSVCCHRIMFTVFQRGFRLTWNAPSLSSWLEVWFLQIFGREPFAVRATQQTPVLLRMDGKWPQGIV